MSQPNEVVTLTRLPETYNDKIHKALLEELTRHERDELKHEIEMVVLSERRKNASQAAKLLMVAYFFSYVGYHVFSLIALFFGVALYFTQMERP